MKLSTDIKESINTLENNEINTKRLSSKSNSSKSNKENYSEDQTSFKKQIKLKSIHGINEDNKNNFSKIKISPKNAKKKLKINDDSIPISKDNLLDKSKRSSKRSASHKKNMLTSDFSKLQNNNDINICTQKNTNYIFNKESIFNSSSCKRTQGRNNTSKAVLANVNVIALKINNIDKVNKKILPTKTKNSNTEEILNESEEKRSNFLKKKSIKYLNNSDVNSSSSSYNFNISDLDITNKKKNYCKLRIEKLIVTTPFLLLVFITSLFSLFANDIKFIWLPKKVDIYFDIVNIIIFAIYILQILISCICENFYLNSIFFWIDCIGICGILFEIQIINIPMLGYDDNYQKNKNIPYYSEKFNEILLILTRIARTSKLLDHIKILKKIKLRKTYEKLFDEKQKKEEEQNKRLHEKMQSFGEDDINESEISNTSKLSSNNNFNNNNNLKISQRRKSLKSLKRFNTLFRSEQDAPVRNSLKRRGTFNSKNFNLNKTHNNEIIPVNSNMDEHNTKQKKIEESKKKEEEILGKIDDNFQQKKLSTKVSNSINRKIVLVTSILLLVITILFEEFHYQDKTNISYTFVNKMLSNNSVITDNYIKDISKILDNAYPIINIEINNSKVIFKNSKHEISKFRYNELKQIETQNKNETINIIYSIKKKFTTLHILFLIETFITYITLFIGSIYFENRICGIFLDPIEVMIEVADKVSKDPMNAKNIDELKEDMSLILKNVEDKKIFAQDDRFIIKEKDLNKKYEKYNNSYEVQIIMISLIKISALLAMSLGEAGVDIIKKNLSSQQEIHLHLKGKKKSAIFGFCNIRNFEKLNIALEEETILLVNEVAEIIHSSVDRFRGDTNKNMGDSFFNVWKFKNIVNVKNNTSSKFIKKDNLLEIDPSNPQVAITADCAILAYLRCLLKINKNLNILAYRHKKKIQKIIPNFKLSMGFGLHLGYGIEGPVGSLFKLEASYLGPDVNIAARLETATKQFNVGILISGSLYKILTDDMKNVLRYVDCVVVKGSTEPIDLYTVDLNYDITPQIAEKFMTTEQKLKKYKEKKDMIEYLIKESGSITPSIISKESYYEFIPGKSDQFYFAWDNGIDSYKKGDWKSAKKNFELCLEEDPEDGPANTLYDFIKNNNFESPKDWKGFRELTYK